MLNFDIFIKIGKFGKNRDFWAFFMHFFSKKTRISAVFGLLCTVLRLFFTLFYCIFMHSSIVLTQLSDFFYNDIDFWESPRFQDKISGLA